MAVQCHDCARGYEDGNMSSGRLRRDSALSVYGLEALLLTVIHYRCARRHTRSSSVSSIIINHLSGTAADNHTCATAVPHFDRQGPTLLLLRVAVAVAVTPQSYSIAS